jgi:uncharacterized protein
MLAASLVVSVLTSIVVDGRTLPVIDMHLHPGDYSTMAPGGKAFIAQNLPPALALYAPALLDRLSDPYAPHVGVAAQTELAGVDHAVLFAVYTHHTTGYYTNESLERDLLDARNLVPGRDEPWAYGYASINFDDWDSDVAGDRLAALRSYFVTDPGLIRGIKLAHAHQQVAFTDAAYQGVYQLAAEVHVPVLLHTGFSPFPGAATDPAYYDPLGLEAVITTFDGAHGAGRVELVLSHVGQGDARAVAHALDLAAAHDNVWLELSALGRPLLVDLDGQMATSTEPQYPFVLTQIRERGLVARTLFATDGPQYSGAVRAYLLRIVAGMQAASYSTDEIAAVLAGNFERLHARAD